MTEKSEAQIKLHKWKLMRDESYMSPLEAQDILKSLKKLHNLTNMDLAMLWWMTPQTIANLLKGTRYYISLEIAKKIRRLWAIINTEETYARNKKKDPKTPFKDLRYYKYDAEWNKQQEMFKTRMLANRDNRQIKRWNPQDIFDLEKSKGTNKFFYSKEFLDWILDPQHFYYYAIFELKSDEKDKHNNRSVRFWRLFNSRFIDFPSDLYNKYLRVHLDFSKMWRPWRYEKVQPKDFIYIF